MVADDKFRARTCNILGEYCGGREDYYTNIQEKKFVD